MYCCCLFPQAESCPVKKILLHLNLTVAAIAAHPAFASPMDPPVVQRNLPDHVIPEICDQEMPGKCRFSLHSALMRLDNKHLYRELVFFYQSSVAYSGVITAIRKPRREGQPPQIRMQGRWWIGGDLQDRLLRSGGALTLAPAALPADQALTADKKKHKKGKPAEINGEGNLLDLTNSRGEPLFYIQGRLGSPLSPGSRNGLTMEYFAGRNFPLDLTIGSYQTSYNVILDEPAKRITNVSLGSSLVVGRSGSQFTLGLSLVRSVAELEHRDEFGDGPDYITRKTFYGIVPKAGLRFTSDNFYVLSLEFGSYEPVDSSLPEYVGDTPVSSTLIQSGDMVTTLGLGVGI